MYPRARITAVATILLLSIAPASAEFPKVERGDLEQNDSRLAGPIDRSKEGELTIASINVRNLGDKRRGFPDFEAIIDFVDEADVILFQEVALGVYDSDEQISIRESKQLSSVVALVGIHLDDDFNLVVSPKPSGIGGGAESSILAHRKRRAGTQKGCPALLVRDIGVGTIREEQHHLVILGPQLVDGYQQWCAPFVVGQVDVRPVFDQQFHVVYSEMW